MTIESDGLVLRPHLRAAGYSDDEVRRMLRSGNLRAVRRGAYVDGPVPAEVTERHRLLVRAALAHLGPNVVVSHASAAVLHELPIWAIPLDRVHVTRDRGSGGRRGRRVHVHGAPLEADELVLLGEVLVTTLARTVIDIARSAPFEQAVAVADAALAAKLVDGAALVAALGRAAGWPGIPNARRVVAFADGRSGSVGESRSRVAIAAAGLPTPVLQWEVRTADGRVRYVDFGWPELRTVGEFDGRVKYGRLLRPGQAPGDAVFEEKCREDALRSEDLGVARWTWRELNDFTPVAKRIRRTFRPHG